jgi:hypothetical protein
MHEISWIFNLLGLGGERVFESSCMKLGLAKGISLGYACAMDIYVCNEPTIPLHTSWKRK